MAQRERNKALITTGELVFEDTRFGHINSRFEAERLVKLQELKEEIVSMSSSVIRPDQVDQLKEVFVHLNSLMIDAEEMLLDSPYLEKLPKS